MQLQVLKRDVKLIKTAKRIFTAGRICSIAAVVFAAGLIILDTIKSLK